MTAPSSSRHQSLLENIGSPLHDVRTRALRSLVFKLSHDLIQLEELVHQHTLLANLLEWFNFEDCSHETLVLDLLLKISKHDQAARTLVTIGGVEFLCQYRSHSDPSLHPLIDSITDQLLALPQSGHLIVVPSTESASLHVDSLTISSIESPSFHTKSTNDVGPAASLQRVEADFSQSPSSSVVQTSTRSSHSMPTISSTKMDATTIGTQQSVTRRWRYEGMDSLTSLAPGGQPHGQGMTGGVVEGMVGQQEEEQARQGTYLPWVFITRSDQHVIAVTQQRLMSDDSEVVCKACRFVRDVLFQDFPAELFTQRPNILQGLLKLAGNNCNLAVCLEGLRCCLVYTEALIKRYLQSTNPSVAPMLARRRPTEEHGTGQPGECREEDYESMTPELLQLMQAEQLSVEGFAYSAVSVCAQLVSSLLTTGLLQDNPLQEVLATTSCLLHCSLQLLKHCCSNKLTPGPDTKLVRSTATAVCDTLSWCLLKWKRWWASTGPTARVVPRELVGTILLMSHVLCELLQCKLSDNEVTRILSDSPGSVVQDLLSLPHLMVCPAPTVPRLIHLLELSNSTAFQSLSKTIEMQSCVKAVMEFVKMDPLPHDQPTFELLARAAIGLNFAYCSQFIDKAVKYCIECCCSSEESGLKEKAATTLLLLMAHCRQCVQEDVYCLLEVLSSESEWAQRVLAVLSFPTVMKELVVFGTTSSAEKVSCSTQTLVLSLLEQRDQDLAIFIDLWPYLESYHYGNDLPSKVREMMETPDGGSSSEGIGRAHKIRCYLRSLFSSNVKIRMWGLSHLLKSLAVEESGSPYLSIPPSTVLHDVLSTASLATPPPTEHALGNRSSFEKESIVKLLEVLRSSSLDLPLRVSALDQLAQVLQDYSLHPFALEEGILEDLNSVIDGVMRFGGKSPKINLLPSALSALRYLVHSHKDIREEMANSPRTLLGLFSAAISIHERSHALYHCAKMLAYLVFNCVAYFTHPALGRGFALPNELLDRFRFPFQVFPHQLVSDHTHPPTLSPTMFCTEPAQSMLSFTWHIAVAGGIHHMSSKDTTLFAAGEQVLPVTDKSVDSLKTFSSTFTLRFLLEDLCSCRHHADVMGTINKIICFLCLPKESFEGIVTRPSLTVWQNALNRFLTQPMSCAADMGVVSCVCNLLTHVLSLGEYGEEFSKWLYEVTLKEGSPLLALLMEGDPQPKEDQDSSVHRDVLQDLIQFYTVLTPHLCTVPLFPLVQALSSVICRAGSSNYYSLPLLEGSLLCLNTATRGLWYSATDTLTVYQLGSQLVGDLKQILASFTAADGGGTLSFMGKGVTRRSLSSLLNITQLLPQHCRTAHLDLVKLLVGEGKEDLHWISSALCDSDVVISSCAYSLLSILCHCVEGASAVLSSLTCQPFGLWGRCLERLVDTTESPLLRYWAGSVLLNLTGLSCKEKKWSTLLAVQTHEGSVVTGVSVLQVMLEHYSFLSKTLRTDIVPQEMEAKLRVVMQEGGDPGQLTTDSSQYCKLMRPDTSEEDGASETTADSRQLQTCQHMLLCELTVSLSPCVVDATAQLLSSWCSVLPEWTNQHVCSGSVVEAILSLLNQDILLLVHAMQETGRLSNVVQDWLVMWRNLLRLMVYLVHNQNKGFLVKMATEEVCSALWHFLSSLVDIIHSGDKVTADVLESVCPLMSGLYQHSQLVEKRTIVVHSALDHWRTFTGVLMATLDHPTAPSLKHVLCLFCGVVKDTLDPSSPGGNPLQDAYRSALKTSLDGEFGREFCSHLLSCVDKKAVLTTQTQNSILKALTLLLACSGSAKEVALNSGIVESSVAELNSLHRQVSMRPSPQHSKQESSFLSEVVLSLNLLRNLVFSCEQAKSVSLECGLVAAIHSMWSWCLGSPRVQLSVLSLLTTLTADCAQACSAMVGCCHGNTTLVHCVLKVCRSHVSVYLSSSRSKQPPAHTFQGVTASFNLVGNIVMSPECRKILKKTNFISPFLATHPKNDLGNPSRCCLIFLWLKLLKNLTLFSDGQHMVANAPGCLDLLLSLWEHGEKSGARAPVLMVLRNLCFYQPLKAQLVNKELFIEMLENTLISNDSSQVKVVTSALKSLLYNCSRTRVVLKKTSCLEDFIVSKGLVRS